MLVHRDMLGRLRRVLHATGWLAVGAGTACCALFTLVAVVGVALLCLVGVGLLLVRPAGQLVRATAGLERRRLRAMGHDVPSPYLGAAPRTVRAVAADAAGRRDLAWLPVHGTIGLLAALIGLQFPLNALRELSFPLWWSIVPATESNAFNGFIHISTWPQAWLVFASAPLWAALWLGLTGWLRRVQARPGLALLAPHPDVDLSTRVAELTASRAAALDAHAVELRRIERALHDGAQNRLVGVTVLIGAARQAAHRDPAQTDAILARAQDAADQALAELRTMVRSILPPVLENRGLSGALSALAADSPVPCGLRVDVPVRCPASVEATGYFVVAESLTNVAKHSGAGRVDVEVRRRGDRLAVRVRDDGRGGADPDGGTGLAGIRQRVAAHDGSTTISSPPGGPTVIDVELPCGS